ncbi:hypothetical protein KFL_010240030 [Klebsormidium nitens]|uniref:Uncharacterized protein n=1 Tax=Klebsormidium nitens TaxID=105231 RepID=A0A1Y1INN5_KLENI|nr:hypothetical protein KFL_010240030 [Klebsormidium nitens]|eukprot:GAQ92480.1 hypothetical protein KFL_010240030 [Klebsormidium nitens]
MDLTEASTASDVADAIQGELSTDEFRQYVIKQKLDARAFTGMKPERLERFCTYDSDGKPGEKITEGDLAKLENLLERMQDALMPEVSESFQSGSSSARRRGLTQARGKKKSVGSTGSAGGSETFGGSKHARWLPDTLAELSDDIVFQRTSRNDDLVPLIGKGGCEELRRMFGTLKRNFDDELSALSEEAYKAINFAKDPTGLRIREDVCSKTLQETNGGRFRAGGKTFTWPQRLMHETLSAMLTEQRRPNREERRIKGMISWDISREIRKSVGVMQSRRKGDRTLCEGAEIRLWSLCDDGKGGKRPQRVAVGRVQDFNEREVEVELVLVEQVQDDLLDLGGGRTIETVEMQKGSIVSWPNKITAWTPYTELPPQVTSSSKAAASNGTLSQSTRGRSSGVSLKRAVEEEEVTSPATSTRSIKRRRDAPPLPLNLDGDDPIVPERSPAQRAPLREHDPANDNEPSRLARGTTTQAEDPLVELLHGAMQAKSTTEMTRTPSPSPINNDIARQAAAPERGAVPQQVARADDQGRQAPKKNMTIKLLYKEQAIGKGTIRSFDAQELVVQIQKIRKGVTGGVEDADDDRALLRLENLQQGDRVYWPNAVPGSKDRSWQPDDHDAVAGIGPVSKEAPEAGGPKGESGATHVAAADDPAGTLKHVHDDPVIDTPAANDAGNEAPSDLAAKTPRTDQSRGSNPKPPAPPLPPRETHPRAKAKPPGTWRRELHKADCPDPLACTGCSRAAAQRKAGGPGADSSPTLGESQASGGGGGGGGNGDEEEVKKWEEGLTKVRKFNHALIVAVATDASTVDEVRSKLTRASLLSYVESLRICSKQKLRPFDFEGLLGLLAAHFLKEEVVKIEAFKGWDDARIPRKDVVRLKGDRHPIKARKSSAAVHRIRRTI